MDRPLLIDISRHIHHRWTGKHDTGIDRVAFAYLDHLAASAQAVVQFRSWRRILTPEDSAKLFDLLRDRRSNFRARLLAFAVLALPRAKRMLETGERFYINVGNSEFDRGDHVRWTQDCGMRAIYMLHDLIPLTHPHFTTGHKAARHRGRVLNALRHAEGIVVNSEATAEELCQFARKEGIASPPVLVAPLAGAGLTSSAGGPIPQDPYFVCLGTIEQRKNHVLLLRIWLRLVERMGDATPRLLLIGKWGVRSGEVSAILQDNPALHERVTLLHECDDVQLGGLIVGARALLLPSLAEGFGLPLVEALQLGTPVIASDIPALREQAHGIAKLVDPADEESWAALVEGFAFSHPERERQLAMMAGFSPPRWEDHFGKLEAWLGGLATLHDSHAHPADGAKALALDGACGEHGRSGGTGTAEPSLHEGFTDQVRQCSNA